MNRMSNWLKYIHSLQTGMGWVFLLLFYILPSIQGGVGGGSALFAQEVIVTVTPVQQVLPPQVLLYINDPGKYFNVVLTNTSQQQQDVYLTLQIEQVLPASGLHISTPTKRQPSKPFSIPANGTRQLTMTEIKTLFNHVPSSEISATPGLFDSYLDGSFGLLPEGQYEARLTAYRWASPQLAAPVVVSSTTTGAARFTVCYKAQAPTFLSPISHSLSLEGSEVCELDALTPMFVWTQPVIACNPGAMGFKYSFKVVEVLTNQHPDDAMDYNPVVYRADNLMAPQCIIPPHVITSQFRTDRTYAAQVTASSTSTNVLDYTMLENEGKSPYRLFKVVTADMASKENSESSESSENSESSESSETSKGETDLYFSWGDDELSGLISPDSLYSFSLPTLLKPQFPENGGARKMFMGNSLKVEWIECLHRGGEGKDPESIEFAYDVQIFSGEKVCNLKAALETEPIYNKRTTELEDSIPWESIKDAVESGTYLVLRVNPVVTKGSSVAFIGDSTHIKDFALIELLSKKYFQCSNMVDITNTTPTQKKASDLKGKTIAIGKYQLTIDDIKAGSKADTWQGKGHVLWEPLGMKVHVCVKFDDLKINTDNIVYEGTAASYSQDPMSSNEVVETLFSEWGIDNWIADATIPYASELSSGVKNAAKDIAKQVDLSTYYGYVKKGQAVYDAFLTGEVKDLYMPLSLPKSVNKSPVDIQISTMKFAATHATMDIIGEFTLPNSKYTKNDILVFGAPRLCISPNRVIPESGTIALLSDFTIVDPKSSYEMTFKAPQNLLEPEDGCYIAWHNSEFEILGIDVDMLIPGLVKEVNGVATKEKPKLNARASISKWDDWMIDEVTIDPFQAEKLPGWTFTASDIVYDHSVFRNSDKMGAFPKGFNKEKAGITGVYVDKDNNTWKIEGDNDWQGLFIKEISIKFPKSLEVGTDGDKRLKIAAQNMFVDKSGATLDVAAANILSVKTGKLGGWAFSLDKVYASFLQDDFNRCGFSGAIEVPLLDGTIGYECKMMKLSTKPEDASKFAYVFKTQQVEGLSLDFFLGKATFEKDQTYFLLESLPDKDGKLDTKVELMLGGDITIGGTEYLNNKIKDSSLPLKFEIPGVHFCGMRLANCASTWTSKYEKDLQKGAKNATLEGLTIYSGKEFNLASGKVYFATGKWSVASMEKTLGPFKFSLDKYDFDYSNNQLSATLNGSITFIDGLELSASAGIKINADLKLPSDLTKLNDISLKYASTDFLECGIDAKFACMELSGKLLVEKGDKSKEGYTGNIKFKMPGDLFTVEANGGYYKDKSGSSTYTYGFFYAKMASNIGVRCDPVVINSINAGFYYNCARKSDTECTPKKGVIGVIAGLSMSTTAGESMLKANMDMTVVYDSQHKRLSTFIFNGDVTAVSGLVTAKANLVYENNDDDRYLQLDITVDATADAETIASAAAGAVGMSGKLGDLKKQLNSAYKKLTKLDPTGSLEDLKEEKGNPDPSKAPKEGESCSASMGAHVSLQVKVTWKEKGNQYSSPHWHLYLGEPDFDNRCTFTLLKFKSPVVSIDFGANGYVCLGNELPNNGRLPDIPTEIRSFLTGDSSKGIEGATVSKANRAREVAMKEFNDQIASIGGGVMFGAQVWGYINVDLGIFYLYTGATAGFDFSIIKLPDDASCTNIEGKPGYKGWYGYGQLYAYLYAKFGIKIDLGFFKKDIDIVDAAIGGVFRMQGPRPSHFNGEARVKLRLLGGLVNVNRKFDFECGEGCDLFYGNALDNFELFGDFTIGSPEKDLGWKEENAINPKLQNRPFLYTQAALDQPFRVLDETEKARLRKNYEGDPNDLDVMASRTFFFRSSISTSYIVVDEYTSEPKSDYALSHPKNTRRFTLKMSDGTNNLVDMTELNPNCWYRMTVTGYAKEIQNGREVDPVYYDEVKKKYTNKAWSQSKTYYFRTGKAEAIPDHPDLQDYVALAYPSLYNKLKHTRSNIVVHRHDLENPTIALTTDLSATSFKNGYLEWRLCDAKGNILQICNNKWVKTGYSCNMTVSEPFKNIQNNTVYRLQLIYRMSTETRGRLHYTNADLMDLKVVADDSQWLENDDTYGLQYERPFMGIRLNSVTFKEDVRQRMYKASVTDHQMSKNDAKIDGVPYRRYDPYLYIAYLANYGFIGGWEINSSKFDIGVTTAQSLIYRDKGGTYEGKLTAGKYAYNCYNDYDKIKALSIYDRGRWSHIAEYPLPDFENEDTLYTYVPTGLRRIHEYEPSKDNYKKVRGAIVDLYRPYWLAEQMCNKVKYYASSVASIDRSYSSNSDRVYGMKRWYEKKFGTSCTTVWDDAAIMIPMYQFPIAWGTCKGDDTGFNAWSTLKGFKDADYKNSDTSRGHWVNSHAVFSGFIGTDVKANFIDSKYKRSWDEFVLDYRTLNCMEKANFSVYRINAYNYVDCVYIVNESIGTQKSISTFNISYPLWKLHNEFNKK